MNDRGYWLGFVIGFWDIEYLDIGYLGGKIMEYMGFLL